MVMIVCHWSVSLFSPCFVEVAGGHICKLGKNMLRDHGKLLGFHGEMPGWVSSGAYSALEEKPDLRFPASSNKFLSVPQFPRL